MVNLMTVILLRVVNDDIDDDESDDGDTIEGGK